ncbi:MAG TPA: hypothetical protein VMG12_44645 [Polyangiaceae bacterium]|nr:hypothetical protein [Polyangiaceae bacterium]
MTVSKDKTFMDWLFGNNPPPDLDIAVHLGEARDRIVQMERATEEQRVSHLQECEAMRQTSLEIEARLAQRQTEMELELARVHQELADAKAASESAAAEVARMSRAAVESRAASLRDAEARRKLSTRCSALQLELDGVRSLLEERAKRETDLEQALHNQRAALEEAQAELAAGRRELERHAELVQSLQHALARSQGELERLRAEERADHESHLAELEQKQSELLAARTEAGRSGAEVHRLRAEAERQRKGFEQSGRERQQAIDAERRAWAIWLGEVWSALIESVGSAAPLALEVAWGQLEPMAPATSTEAAEARLRELVSARALCRNVTIHEQQQELRLELELGPAIEGTAAGWLGILATRYVSAMLERPLRAREIELTGERLAVHALRSGAGAAAE